MIVFAFGANGERDDYHGNYHPATLWEEGADDPYHHDSDEANEMMHEAFDALPKPPEQYDRDDAARGGWVMFDHEGLVSGEKSEPLQEGDL